MDDKEPNPVVKAKGLTRRSFLKVAAATLGGVALASLPGDPGPAAQVGKQSGRREVAEKSVEVAVVTPEAPKQPRYAKLEDLLGEGYKRQDVTQGEGQEYPPHDVENGPGLFVTSRMEGMDLPVLDQEGPIFYKSGHKGEATQGGTVIGEGDGVTVVQDPDKMGSGANVFTSLVLGSNPEGRQALLFSVDNAFFNYNEDKTLNNDLTLELDKAVISVEGPSGTVTHVVERGGVNGDIGWQFLIPLGGFPPQLGEGIDGRNVVPSVVDGYKAVNKLTISLQEKDGQNLTFSYQKKGMPEQGTQG